MDRLVMGEEVRLAVHADKVVNRIDPMVYGHFFEHIYNGGDNGIWGEMVWNRSFEYTEDSAGKWAVKDGLISETALTDGAKLVFGDPSWKDYEFTFEAKKTAGNEGFLALVRVNDAQFFWVNIAGWTNTVTRLQHLGPPRSADLGPRGIPTKVVVGEWYKVRVRCEGNRVQAWLGDQQVCDATLPADLEHAGCVGLGAWQTTAEFRNCKVTDLSGKVLFDGVPELPKPNNAAGMHWETFGAGKVETVTNRAFNDQTAVHIDARAGETGILQKHFALKKGEAYHGSLYVYGETAAPEAGGHMIGGSVQLVSGDALLGNVPLPPPDAQWTMTPIDFVASADAPDATLRVTLPAGANAWIDQVSLMSESSIKNDGFRPDVYEAFAALKPTIIRWPGGCYLEQYHWKNGIGPQTKRTKNLTPMWEDYDPNALGTDEYMTLCRKLGAEPLLVVNTGMHVTGTKNAAEWAPWVKEACEWVEYVNGPATSEWGKVRAANGHPEPYHVKYFEIDNELWRSLQPSPAVYAEAVKLFSEAMRKTDPSITVIAHGGNGTDRRYDTTLVNRAAASFDVLSIHHYTDPPKFETGVADQDRLYSDLEKLIAASANPKITLDVSEWNLQTIDWRTGLYAGGLLNTFEKHGDRLTIGGPALLFRYTGARDWDNAFINFDQRGWFPGPNYVVMKLWREHFAPQRVAVDPPTGGPEATRLNVVGTRTADGNQVILKAVNPTDQEMQVTATLDGFGAGSASMEIVAPGDLRARNSMDKPNVVKAVKAEAAVKGQDVTFTMPAYSAGVVVVAK
jgi:alpha-N-arabinofuranosidase